MTDKKKLIKLLKVFGVGYTEDSTSITLKAETNKIEGYSGFECIFNFTLEGEFINIGIWE